MTVPAALDHVAALEAHLETHLEGFALVGVGEAPDGEPPYLTIHPDPGEVTSTRLADRRSHIAIHVMVHAIGTGPEQALWTMDHARQVLLTEPLQVEGRKVFRITQTLGPQPMQRDTDVQPPLFYQVAEYEIRSDPASA